MIKKVYISEVSSFLPNAPVSNDEMEAVLGMVGNLPSRTRNIILRNNGIKQRYYALDPQTGAITHSNAELTAEAIRGLAPYAGFTLADLELLCCGTSSPDQFMPAHGSMVHGQLGCPALEVATTTGICLSGISSLKYVAMAIACGMAKNGVATGSEQASTFMRSALCAGSGRDLAGELEKTPQLSFEADFLRWMLSDGAGACFLTAEKPTDRLALQVDWIEITSHAHLYEPCMYAGSVKKKDGTLQGWRCFDSLEAAVAAEAFSVKQDSKLLNQEIVPFLVKGAFTPLIAKYDLKPEDISWFLPHYSSDYFRLRIADCFKELGFAIDLERWFTNLSTKGNTGSASIYIMLDELLHSGKLRKGETILCLIPESGRFSCGYMHFTVV
ncbi:MAG: beta-ketoacyl-ACP synthase III [Proteobacteria bacterium]|nr:beta-ketoacyl-ACP synthase III [Pseudomonadota bacterium]MBU1639045.1 beta-ketoacyl-ACP synthase III [Pseudomonadota bacterium]